MRRREAGGHAVDERGDGEHVEHLAAVAPHVAVAVLILTLVIKAINLDSYMICMNYDSIICDY